MGETSNMRKTSVAILGVPIDNLTMGELLDSIETKIAEGGFHQIATANVDFLIKSIHDEELQEVLCRCNMVVADGMPLVWASRLMGTGLKERVTGSDLVPRLAELSARNGHRLFLLGADEESSRRAAAWMEEHYPGVCIAGRYAPPIQPLEEMDHEEILSRIKEARPDILLVAFGNPKQEKWLAMHRSRLEVPVCIGIGASLDFLAGKVSRAPSWMRNIGMEWFYRMCQEPSRLAKRYASNLMGLLHYLPLQLMTTLVQAKDKAVAQLTKDVVGSAVILRIYGNFTGDLLPYFDAEARNAVLSRLHVIIDLSHASFLGPDALGSLVHLRDLTRRSGRELWLAGLQKSMLRLLWATRLGSAFRSAPKAADALRRIEPEFIPFYRHANKDWAYCRIAGQLVPIPMQEVPEVYRQVQLMLEHTLVEEQAPPPAAATTVQSQENLVKALVPADAA